MTTSPTLQHNYAVGRQTISQRNVSFMLPQ